MKGGGLTNEEVGITNTHASVKRWHIKGAIRSFAPIIAHSLKRPDIYTRR